MSYLRITDSLGELTVRTEGPGWHNFWKVYADGTWEDWTLSELQRANVKGRVVVDIGAWIGPVSLWASRLGAKVIAVEPDPVAYEALHWNVIRNGADVETICAAVTRSDGIVRITPKVEFGNSSTRISDTGLATASFTVPTLLDLFGIEPSDVALVKMDIEGHEYELMPSLEPWLSKHNIPFLVSYHGEGE